MKKSKVILLLSGGFDSTIAGYLLQKKEYDIIPLHLSNTDFAGEESIKKSTLISKKFGWKKVYLIDIANILQSLVDNCRHSYYFVLMKRFMLQLAGKIADKEEANFIATGESLGQVSSQTLTNIKVIEKATKYRVLKPLITFDKEEIVSLSRKIETFDISSGPEVCDLLGPKHPIINANIENTIKEEGKLDYDALLTDCIENLQIIEN
ncbi:MAG: hypothetical protein KAS63_04040 [Candidatus Heimdallarchaeota archaeon]|nr:hypothetical protein [Candidatus Heimdallarchaeota archaeon]MCK4954505.1 hypothetical protein [Candidatus Heimdallarchaeota archaeon]